MQEALLPELETQCGNPECTVALPQGSRKRYCSTKCVNRALYLRRGGKEWMYGRSLTTLYGMPVEEYRQRVADQNGRCAVCGDEPAADKRLHVDHDHQTGAIRDLLCRWCNYALGNAKDDPRRLRAMADYLERHAQSTQAAVTDGSLL